MIDHGCMRGCGVMNWPTGAPSRTAFPPHKPPPYHGNTKCATNLHPCQLAQPEADHEPSASSAHRRIGLMMDPMITLIRAESGCSLFFTSELHRTGSLRNGILHQFCIRSDPRVRASSWARPSTVTGAVKKQVHMIKCSQRIFSYQRSLKIGCHSTSRCLNGNASPAP